MRGEVEIVIFRSRDARHYAEVTHESLGWFYVYGKDADPDGHFYGSQADMIAKVAEAMTNPEDRHIDPPGGLCPLCDTQGRFDRLSNQWDFRHLKSCRDYRPTRRSGIGRPHRRRTRFT